MMNLESDFAALENIISEGSDQTGDAVWHFYKSIQWEEPTETLRFEVGSRVKAYFGGEWVPATVVALWYREVDWPVAFVAPYRMKLDRDDNMVYAPVDGKSFLIAIDETPNLDVVDKEMLLGFGSISNCRSWEQAGHTPLHACCFIGGDPNILKRLLRRPMRQYHPDNNINMWRESPLCMAAQYGKLHCAILLLAAGADPRVPNCWGKTPAVVAEENGYDNGKVLVELLKRREAELNEIDAKTTGGAARS